MDKRQLRQSAFADFMQSLEHLDELLGDTAEASVLDDDSHGSESSKAHTLPQNADQHTSMSKTPKTNSHQPRR